MWLPSVTGEAEAEAAIALTEAFVGDGFTGDFLPDGFAGGAVEAKQGELM